MLTLQEWGTIVALVLSFYGAIISSVLGFSKFREYQRNLRIYLEWQAFYEKCHLVIANYGVRPITIKRIIVRAPEDGWAGLTALEDEEPVIDVLPNKLEYGKEGTFVLTDFVAGPVYFEEYELLVYDSEGNEYRPTEKREFSPRHEGMGKFTKLKSKRVWEKLKKSR